MSVNPSQWTPLEPSLWSKTAPPVIDLPALAGEARTEVAVIGAGYTGLSAALHLARAGQSVVVLEATEPGFGGSGRNNGHCVPEWLWQTPNDMLTQYGAERGERMNDFQAGAANLVFSLIREHQIECEAVQNGMLKITRSRKLEPALRERAQQWRRRGKAVRYVEPPELREYVVSDAFIGAMLLESGGHLNPLAYCRGLASAAVNAGATVHAQSPVTAIEREGDGWRLRTPTGALSASTVIMATNAFRHGLWPGIDQAFVPVRAMGIATDPLPEEVRRAVLPGDHNFQEYADFGLGLLFFFFDAQGRLVTGGAIGRGVNADAEYATRWAGRALTKAFPQLGEVRFAHHWEGLFDVSPTKTVGVHELAPRLYAALGFSGRGIPTATAMGRELANMIIADDPQAMAFPLTPLPRHRFGRAKAFIWHDIWLPLMSVAQRFR